MSEQRTVNSEQRTVISEQSCAEAKLGGCSEEATVDSCLPTPADDRLFTPQPVRRNVEGVETGGLRYPECPPDAQQGLCFKLSCKKCWADYSEKIKLQDEASTMGGRDA